LEVLHKDNFI